MNTKVLFQILYIKISCSFQQKPQSPMATIEKNNSCGGAETSERLNHTGCTEISIVSNWGTEKRQWANDEED